MSHLVELYELKPGDFFYFVYKTRTPVIVELDQIFSSVEKRSIRIDSNYGHVFLGKINDQLCWFSIQDKTIHSIGIYIL